MAGSAPLAEMERRLQAVQQSLGTLQEQQQQSVTAATSTTAATSSTTTNPNSSSTTVAGVAMAAGSSSVPLPLGLGRAVGLLGRVVGVVPRPLLQALLVGGATVAGQRVRRWQQARALRRVVRTRLSSFPTGNRRATL